MPETPPDAWIPERGPNNPPTEEGDNTYENNYGQDLDTEGSSTDGDAFVEVVDAPYLFNPPLHPSLYSPVVTLSGRDPDEIYRTSPSVTLDGPSADVSMSYRLGRIMMTDTILNFAWPSGDGPKRYGFRFLYNPETIAAAQNISTDFIPDPSSPIGMILQQGLENITFKLLLNRMPEVQGGSSKEDYPVPISDEDWEGIQERGTHYDLEFLYRICNGRHDTQMREQTGDIGLLLPNPAMMIIGPNRTYGAVTGIASRDLTFNSRYVPMLTEVVITFGRYLAFDPAHAEEYATTLAGAGVTLAGDTSGGGDGSSDGGSDGGGGGQYAPGTTLTGDQVFEVAKRYFDTTDKAIKATRISWGESRWNTGAHNPDASTGDNSYGLWQINMLGNLGPSRRAAYNLPNNEALFDADTNARVAWGIYRGAGWHAWSVAKPWNSHLDSYYDKCPWRGPGG